MPEPIRVVHYLNQVYAGIGRDEKADLPAEVRERPVGPARLLNHLMGDRGSVVSTIVCGDGYFQERRTEVLALLETVLRESRADLVVAGPVFNLESYGLACGAVCLAAQDMGVPALTAMTTGNPASLAHAGQLRVMPTEPAPGDMMETVSQLCRIALDEVVE